jgi:antitoxin component YwqK of YwqJK toxin-antitoxin module
VTYFDDGTIQQEGSIDLRTNNFVGEVKKYHPNGKLFVTTNFKDGEQHGLFTQYFENGGVEYKIKYENGEETGSTTYDQQGNIVSQDNMD